MEEVVVADAVDAGEVAVVKDKRYIPQRLLLQWHITGRCNLNCTHCYQDSEKCGELDFNKLTYILQQYKELLTLWRKQSGQHIGGHITVTGGEPFVRNDFIDLLNLFAINNKYFTFAILTNGTHIDKKMATKLSQLNPRFVQVSVEGTEKTHDQIRGEGSYQRTISAIKHLVKAGVKTIISFTAHRQNYNEFNDVAQLGRKLKVDRVWSDRLIPSGNGSDLKDFLLTPAETKSFFNIMKKAQRKSFFNLFNTTEISMHRALQFLVSGGRPYHCTAGDSLITVQPNGDLYPCRRMPISVGNLLETDLLELYYKSELFQKLRHKESVSSGCEECQFSQVCRGGLKCLSHAITGNPFNADPGCWMNKDRMEKMAHIVDEIN